MIRLIPLLAAFVVLLWHPTEGWSGESDFTLTNETRVAAKPSLKEPDPEKLEPSLSPDELDGKWVGSGDNVEITLLVDGQNFDGKVKRHTRYGVARGKAKGTISAEGLIDVWVTTHLGMKSVLRKLRGRLPNLTLGTTNLKLTNETRVAAEPSLKEPDPEKLEPSLSPDEWDGKWVGFDKGFEITLLVDGQNLEGKIYKDGSFGPTKGKAKGTISIEGHIDLWVNWHGGPNSAPRKLRGKLPNLKLDGGRRTYGAANFKLTNETRVAAGPSLKEPDPEQIARSEKEEKARRLAEEEKQLAEIARLKAAEKERKAEIARLKAEEEERARRTDLAQKKQAELARKKQAGLAQKKQAELAQKKQAELALKKQAELARKKQAELARKKQAELARKKQAELARKKQAELALKKQAELAQKKQAELALKKQAELARKKQAELARKKQAELALKKQAELALKKQAELARKKQAELALKKQAELARRKAEEEERTRQLELARLKAEEDERVRQAELARRKTEEAKQQAELARRKAEEAKQQAELVSSSVHFGTYHALVIGNDEYTDLPNLKNGVQDAKDMSLLLKDMYGFEVQTLLNASRSDIIGALSKLRAKLEYDNNLLIYYAGHGFLDVETDEGYWLPVDAGEDDPSNWLPVSTITNMVKAIPAKHVMIVADSCYSGTLVRSAPAKLLTAKERDVWLQRMARKRSRTAMVSGGLEPVMDGGGGKNSPFAKALMDVLRDNQSVMEGNAVYEALKRPVALASSQTPEYSDIRRAGHDGGEFLFVRMGGVKAQASTGEQLNVLTDTQKQPSEQADMLFWQSVKDSRNADMLGAYLDKFPNGTFATLAHIKIKELGDSR